MFSFLTYCLAVNEGEIFPDLKNFFYSVSLSEIPQLKSAEGRDYKAQRKYSLGLGSFFAIESISSKLGFLPELLLYTPSGVTNEGEEKLFIFKPSSNYKESFLGGALRFHMSFIQPIGDHFSFSFFSGPTIYYYNTRVYVNSKNNDYHHYFHSSMDIGMNVIFGLRDFKIGLKGEGHYFFRAQDKKLSYSIGIVLWQVISPF